MARPGSENMLACAMNVLALYLIPLYFAMLCLIQLQHA